MNGPTSRCDLTHRLGVIYKADFATNLPCPVTSVTLLPERTAGYFQEGFPQVLALAFP